MRPEKSKKGIRLAAADGHGYADNRGGGMDNQNLWDKLTNRQLKGR